MKKATFTRMCHMMSRGETPKGGWGRAFGVGQTTDGQLARKAAEGKIGARTVGVVSKAFIQMQKDRHTPIGVV